METLQELVRTLEAQPEMRKGILIETALQDPSIDWDAIFQSLSLRGRHRTKKYGDVQSFRIRVHIHSTLNDTLLGMRSDAHSSAAEHGGGTNLRRSMLHHLLPFTLDC